MKQINGASLKVLAGGHYVHNSLKEFCITCTNSLQCFCQKGDTLMDFIFWMFDTTRTILIGD